MARIAEHEPPFEFSERQREPLPLHPVAFQVDRVRAAVKRGEVVLPTRRDANDDRLNVLGNFEQLRARGVLARHSGQRAAKRNVQGGGAAEARPSRRLGAGLDGQAAPRFKEEKEFAEQRQGRFAVRQVVEGLKRLADPSVLGNKNEPAVRASLHNAGGVAAHGDIDRQRAGMEQVKRPDIDGPTRKVNSDRRSSLDSHPCLCKCCAQSPAAGA